MPSLNVPRTCLTNSASSIPRARLNASRCGTVASPTPTVPISSDSIRRMAHSRPSVFARAAAAIQPAVPPPTMTMSLRRESLTVDGRPSELGSHGHAQLARIPRDIAMGIIPPPRDQAVRREVIEVVDVILHVEDVQQVDAQVER